MRTHSSPRGSRLRQVVVPALLGLGLAALLPPGAARGEAPSTPAFTPPPLPAAAAATGKVRVVKGEGGTRLQVDGRDLLVVGINWSYTPVGENYSYNLWEQPDAFIKKVLADQMGLLRAMGVNAIRQAPDIPPRWVTYIHQTYGIYTALNPQFGRYGISIGGTWVGSVDYGNPTHRKAIRDDTRAQVERYRSTPGILLWLLGNESNYGLEWTSFETSQTPTAGKEHDRARPLYSLFGEAIREIKEMDPDHPVSLTNGDLGYIELVAELCKGLDIFGSNVYRGASFGDFFQKVKDTLDLPVLFSEFGSDAFDAHAGKEDATAQAEIELRQWQEIYEQSAGKGRVGNAIGGFLFQFSDGWWKTGQTIKLDEHDTMASWSNEAYPFDYVPGENNMNEEWFGIAALDPPDRDKFYKVRPRTAYYVLQAALRLEPYAPETTRDRVRAHFGAIDPAVFAPRYQASEALHQINALSWLRLSNLRFLFDASASAGNAATTRGKVVAFDHTESLYTDVVLQPNAQIYGRASVNLVGNVAQNRLDSIFYENRARAFSTVQALGPNGQPIVRPVGAPDPASAPIQGPDGNLSTRQLNALNHVTLYQAEFALHQRWFDAEGFYRVGHYHWGDEGDLFGIYRNAYYGPNLDIYNGTAPFGVVFSGRQALEGLKVAIGPELWWGANPAVVAKYRRSFGPLAVTLLHWEDLAKATGATTSGAIHEPQNRRTTLGFELRLGSVGLDVGGIMAGSTRLGESFYWTRATNGPSYNGSGYQVLQDKIAPPDMFGGKARITIGTGKVRWYAQGQVRGLVSDGGPQAGIILTDWSMLPSGKGNQVGASTGAAFGLGALTIAPHFLYQQPLVGPVPQKLLTDPVTGQPVTNGTTGQPLVVPAIVDDVAANGVFYRGVRPRSVLTDPFAVRDNRLTYGFELLLVWDPTPGTWFFNFDRNLREDARFAFALDAVYRIQPTTTDSGIVVLANGAVVPIGGGAPAHDVWDATFRWVANAPHGGPRLFGSLYVAQKQTTGIDPRLITAAGGDVTLLWKTLFFQTTLKFNDWGPYDYQRDFNLTFPVQWYGNLAWNLSIPRLDWIGTRIGARAQVRTLDKYSDGYLDPAHPNGRGLEYEAGGYVMLSL